MPTANITWWIYYSIIKNEIICSGSSITI